MLKHKKIAVISVFVVVFVGLIVFIVDLLTKPPRTSTELVDVSLVRDEASSPLVVRFEIPANYFVRRHELKRAKTEGKMTYLYLWALYPEMSGIAPDTADIFVNKVTPNKSIKLFITTTKDRRLKNYAQHAWNFHSHNAKEVEIESYGADVGQTNANATHYVDNQDTNYIVYSKDDSIYLLVKSTFKNVWYGYFSYKGSLDVEMIFFAEPMQGQHQQLYDAILKLLDDLVVKFEKGNSYQK